MEVDLNLFEIDHVIGFCSPILLVRRNETAEKMLELAKRATIEGRISTDHAEILRAIETHTDPVFNQQLKGHLKSGQIVCVILDK